VEPRYPKNDESSRKPIYIQKQADVLLSLKIVETVLKSDVRFIFLIAGIATLFQQCG